MADTTVIDPKTNQPVVTPPVTEPKKEEPKPLTKAQLDGVQKFASSFLPEKFAAPKEETAEEKVAREKVEKEKADKKAAPPKPKPKIKAVNVNVQPPAPLSADQIAEAAARGVATAMAPKKDETVKKDETPELSASDQRKISVLQQMEKMATDKYKGISDRYKTSTLELKQYAEKWEREHPGQEFNEEDAEHEDFFKTHDVDWSDEDYTEAVAEIRTQSALEEERKKTNERLSVFERKDKLREAAPEIEKAQVQPARLLWAQMGDEFKELVDANGVLNMEKAVELKKADPLTFSMRVQAANALQTEVGELYKVMNGLADYDAKNPVHINIGNFAAEREREMAGKPIEDRIDSEGKDFLPAEAYYKLSKAKRAEYWTFSVQDVAALRASHLSQLTRNLIAAEEKKHEEWAAARGFSKVPKEASATPTAKPEPEPEPEPADGKPRSPSSDSESRLTANRRGTGNAPPDPGLTFLQRQLGKK